MTPLISIVIAAYNAEKYIEESIQSALLQTIDDKEIIIVNDGSIDQTQKIINKYKDYPDVRVYNEIVNKGANYTYNFGAYHSKGEYLTFLDADDIFLPSYCEDVLNKMTLDNADIGFADLYAMDGTIKQSTTLYGAPRDERHKDMYGGNEKLFPYGDMVTLRKFSLTMNSISPRSIYKKNLFFRFGYDDSRLKIANDWLRNLKFILNGVHCTFVSTPLGYYRYHPDGNSQKDLIANLIENSKLMEIILTEYLYLLTEEEKIIANLKRKDYRMQLFNVLSGSNLSNAQVVQFLIEKRFFL